MANNIPSNPTFVPRIIMVATNTQETQTPHSTSSVSTQTHRQVLQANATQTQQFQPRDVQTQTFQRARTISIQTSPPQTSRSVQTEHIIPTQTDDTQITDFSETDDGASAEITQMEESQIDDYQVDESTQPLRRSESSRKRKKPQCVECDQSCGKQRKKVRFTQYKQNKPKVTHTITRQESPVIDLTVGHETQGDTIHSDVVLYEQSQPLETFPTTSTLSTNEPSGTNPPPPYFSDIDTTSTIPLMNIQQTLAQPIIYPNRFEQMSSQ